MGQTVVYGVCEDGSSRSRKFVLAANSRAKAVSAGTAPSGRPDLHAPLLDAIKQVAWRTLTVSLGQQVGPGWEVESLYFVVATKGADALVYRVDYFLSNERRQAVVVQIRRVGELNSVTFPNPNPRVLRLARAIRLKYFRLIWM